MIRGRSVQNVMSEGKNQRVETIRELRSTHALQAAEQQVLNDQKQATLLLQRQQQLNEIKVCDLYVRSSTAVSTGYSIPEIDNAV